MDRHKKIFWALCIGAIAAVIAYANAWIKFHDAMAALNETVMDIYMEDHQETRAVDADG